jgi:1-acyl-sn-glycerol-3-phosphate acyltransferase
VNVAAVAAAARLAPIAGWMLTPASQPTSSPVIASHRQHDAARVMRALHRIDVTVDGRLPDGPAVYVSNHLGYFDPIVLGSIAPCIALAKREVREWPVVGPRLRWLGVLFVDRGCPFSGARALRAMRRALSLGTSVLNFAEGTTTDGSGVLPFHRGAFGVARLARVPVVPVRLSYDDPRVAWVGDDTFVPHYLSTLARGRVRARVVVGRPIAPFAAPSARGLADLARAAVEDLPA